MLANSQTQYGWTAIVLHWAMALLLFGQWTLGQTMVRISDQRLAFDLFQWHKSFGLLVLALAILRLAWRLANPRPLLPAGTPRLEQAAAASTRRALYALMILLPLSGWALVSASVLEIPTLAFYLFLVPHLPLPKSEAAEAAWTLVHQVLGWLMFGLVFVHVLAALRHHFLLRDRVLVRMLRPGTHLTHE